MPAISAPSDSRRRTLAPAGQANSGLGWLADELTAAADDWAEQLTLQPKQEIAERLTGQADELLYGGAAGGGKTHWLVVHCIRQMVRHPGNRGVIFRRVYPSLARTIVPKALELVGLHARYNDTKHFFTFPNGSILELASLQYAKDVRAYQGAELGVVAFEEVTEFLASQLDFMKSRLRAPIEGVRPHLIATTNPGGPGHHWVKRRYVRPKPEDLEPGAERPAPLEIWRPAATDDDPEPLTRVFVPATLRDNPILLDRDPDYLRRLRSLTDRGLRLALEKGDWDAIEDNTKALWSSSILDRYRVRRPPDLERTVVGVDPSGGAGEQGIIVAAKGVDGDGYVLDDRTCKLSPAGWGRRAVMAWSDWQADVICVETNYGGEMAKSTILTAAEGLLREETIDHMPPVKILTASKSKRVRAEPVSAAYDDGRWHHVGRFDELEEQQTDWVPDESDYSPDRIDALVWCAHELKIIGGGGWTAAYGIVYCSSCGRGFVYQEGRRCPHCGTPYEQQ